MHTYASNSVPFTNAESRHSLGPCPLPPPRMCQNGMNSTGSVESSSYVGRALPISTQCRTSEARGEAYLDASIRGIPR